MTRVVKGQKCRRSSSHTFGYVGKRWWICHELEEEGIIKIQLCKRLKELSKKIENSNCFKFFFLFSLKYFMQCILIVFYLPNSSKIYIKSFEYLRNFFKITTVLKILCCFLFNNCWNKRKMTQIIFLNKQVLVTTTCDSSIYKLFDSK